MEKGKMIEVNMDRMKMKNINHQNLAQLKGQRFMVYLESDDRYNLIFLKMNKAGTKPLKDTERNLFVIGQLELLTLLDRNFIKVLED